MTKKIISPFDDEPLTERFTEKNGDMAFRVKPLVLTPERVKLARFLAGLSTFGLMVGGFYALTDKPDVTIWLWLAILLGPVLAFPLLNGFWQSSFYITIEIILTTDQFKFRSQGRWQIYDRRLPHKFALILHDKTQAEKDANELAVRQGQAHGQVIAPKRYYGDSFHLSFEYLGQRNDVLTVYGHKEALEILNRLKACDEVLDGEIHMGDGTALDPEDQWTDQPGGID